ncbi:MAG: RNA polymerase sigma factor [Steroidobacteraceae bacterium]|nr:RNA polymerase sigma factor [Steroidobacteraceae bacterium]
MDKLDFIRACREGGAALERALVALDRELFAGLYRECRRAVRDAAAARDLVQDTFIKVWQRCATFQGDSELRPWVRAILRHTMLDAFRRAESRVSLDDTAAGTEIEARIAELSAVQVAAPHDEAHARQLAETFQRGWARFEQDCPAHAAVIVWISEDGLDNAAVAQLLGRTPGATREYISQCRKKLRVYLADWFELAFGASSP